MCLFILTVLRHIDDDILAVQIERKCLHERKTDISNNSTCDFASCSGCIRLRVECQLYLIDLYIRLVWDVPYPI